MHILNGKIYIEPNEASSIPRGTMCSNIARGKYESIPNPQYNGKNAKKLILVDSLPEPHKSKILEKFKGEIKTLESGLEQGLKTNPKLEVTEIITEATADVIKMGERFVSSEYLHFINKEYINHLAYFEHYHTGYTNKIRYARTCALILKIWQDGRNLLSTNQSSLEYKRMRRSFVVNISQMVELTKDLNVAIPKSDFRLTEWMDKVLKAIDTPVAVYELVIVKNSANKNNERFTDEQKRIANSIYNQGNAPSITKVYNDLLHIGEVQGWWMIGGEYKPITIATLCNHFKEMKNIASLGRKGNMKFINDIVPTVSRSLPEYRNEMWSVDGSPLDLLIYENGKSRQLMNTFRVYDVGTSKWLSVSYWRGGGEPANKVIEALNKAMRMAGVLPKTLQCDRGAGKGIIEQWCNERGVHFIPANTGLARAKIAESLIGRFGKILKTRASWSGQNRTALGNNSQTSPEYKIEAQKMALTFDKTAHWLETEGLDTWNSTEIATLERKPCGKTPDQLWDSKLCRGIALNDGQRAVWCGHHHRIKLTIDGLSIQNNNEIYTYFPDITTEIGRERGAEIFLKTPLKGHSVKGKLTIYVEQYGDYSAYIYDKDIEDGGKLLDTWVLKPKVAYVATLNNDTELHSNYKKFQYLIKNLAKEQKQTDTLTLESFEIVDNDVATIRRDAIERRDEQFIENTMLKEVQQSELNEEFETIEDDGEYIETVHKITGEIIKVKISK